MWNSSGYQKDNKHGIYKSWIHTSYDNVKLLGTCKNISKL